MLRLSDARMSGTSYGACVLHVAPESFVGGPLALLRTGDIVRCDVPGRRIDMAVSESELAARRANWKKPEPRFERGYGWAFSQHVGQADQGCDFDYPLAGVRPRRRRAGHLLMRRSGLPGGQLARHAHVPAARRSAAARS